MLTDIDTASLRSAVDCNVAMFGSERLQRLARVKQRYDPDNLFRFNLNIAPIDQAAVGPR